MEMGPISAVLLHVRRLAAIEGVSHLTDAALLDGFLTNRDEAAFAALLHRHGPMVWGLCQRLLHHRQNAEDVFQATFLTLLRKASSIRKQESLACWLHGVAYRLARRVQADQARRLLTNAEGAASAANPAEQASGHEVQAAFDEELARLPEKYRLPLVLCYLEGQTRDEAAEQLGWSLGTLKRRLEQGRAALRDRLTRRGVTLGAALFAASVGGDAFAATVPPTLMNSTWLATNMIAGGQALAEVAGAQVAALTEGMVAALAPSKLKWVAALAAATLALAGAGGVWTASTLQAKVPPSAAIAAEDPPSAREDVKPVPAPTARNRNAPAPAARPAPPPESQPPTATPREEREDDDDLWERRERDGNRKERKEREGKRRKKPQRERDEDDDD
jgi:RNA polymerase sigma factor (sigma-70 family)